MAKRLFLLSLLVVGLCTLRTSNPFTLEIEAPRPPEEVRLEDIENPDAEFRVKLWTDREDATYKVGEEVKLYFETNKDCHLTLFNVGTSGKVHIIFPNEYHEDNFVKANTTYSVPPEGARFILKAGAPAGEDLVKAIATLARVPLYEDEDTEPVGPVQELTKHEAQVAKDILVILKPVEVKRWATAEKVIEIKK